MTNFGDPSLSTGATAIIENTTIHLDKSRSKNRVQGLKNLNSPLKKTGHGFHEIYYNFDCIITILKRERKKSLGCYCIYKGN